MIALYLAAFRVTLLAVEHPEQTGSDHSVLNVIHAACGCEISFPAFHPTTDPARPPWLKTNFETT